MGFPVVEGGAEQPRVPRARDGRGRERDDETIVVDGAFHLNNERRRLLLRGSDEVVAYIERKLGTKTGETTPDGRIYLKPEEECLAACCGAPMMMPMESLCGFIRSMAA